MSKRRENLTALMRRRLLAFCIALPLCLMASGCGKKTLPVPPQTMVPRAITDLQAILDEKGTTLVWSTPERNENGSLLQDATGFEISRAVVPVESYCDTCPIPFGPPMQVPGAQGAGARQSYSETLLRANHRYFYKVRTVASWGRMSSYSEPVSFFWDTPVAPPEELRADAGDGTVQLSWSPPQQFLDGSKLMVDLTYQVFRSSNGINFQPVSAALPETNFRDAGLINGQEYHYRVRAIHTYRDTDLPGAPSKTASAAPSDMTPPAPPRNLTAIATPGGVKLAWSSGTEEDLSGYLVYRRAEVESTWQRIGKVEEAMIQFIDRQAPPGFQLYAVSAFDSASPANESSLSMAASVEVAK